MNGGGNSTEISIIGGEVILTYSDTEWWYDDDDITEYKLDKAVLTDIESVFRKYKMQNWNNKKFSDMFVADGPSYSYSFRFDDNTAVVFSSQVYPTSYSEKLDELDKVIEQYKESAVLEPGLVTKEKTEEELVGKGTPDNVLVWIEVYEYSKDEIRYRISNGTNENVTVSNSVKLVRNSDGEVLYDESSEYPIEVFVNRTEEVPVTSGRLEEGVYTLYAGDYSAEFEIRLRGDN
ncbi:MAG: hypothetical protein ACI4J4_04685 [Ruminiclostridium sp.]